MEFGGPLNRELTKALVFFKMEKRDLPPLKIDSPMEPLPKSGIHFFRQINVFHKFYFSSRLLLRAENVYRDAEKFLFRGYGDGLGKCYCPS